MSPRTAWRVSGPRWTFAVVEENGIVVEAAPISEWAIGKRLDVVLAWWKGKGADQIARLTGVLP